MPDDDDQSMEDGEEQDPNSIYVINAWLDDITSYGTDGAVVRDDVLTRQVLATWAGVTPDEASQMLSDYRQYNWQMDERCFYVIAHEGHYGRLAPWRIQSTVHDIPETTRRIYRLNQARHLTWDFFDHAKKMVKSFGAESRQALVHVDAATTSVAAGRQRQAMRDWARDLLQDLWIQAQRRAQTITDGLNIPRAMRDEYTRYFYDGFWPYVEVMVDEEVMVLDSLINPPAVP